MTQIATTIDQSRRLIEAGLDPASADMHYRASAFECKEGEWVPQESGSKIYLVAENPSREMDIPAWSLSRLIDISREDSCHNNSEDAIECLVKHICFLIRSNDIPDEYLKPKEK